MGEKPWRPVAAAPDDEVAVNGGHVPVEERRAARIRVTEPSQEVPCRSNS
jgi:hypothetical protein